MSCCVTYFIFILKPWFVQVLFILFSFFILSYFIYVLNLILVLFSRRYFVSIYFVTQIQGPFWGPSSPLWKPSFEAQWWARPSLFEGREIWPKAGRPFDHNSWIPLPPRPDFPFFKTHQHGGPIYFLSPLSFTWNRRPKHNLQTQ